MASYVSAATLDFPHIILEADLGISTLIPKNASVSIFPYIPIPKLIKRSHLLGKKSWNVYNPENIARVRRDEAQAKAEEEEAERRMQEVDAERRIKILRGEQPSPPPGPQSPPPSHTARENHHDEVPGRYRKRRRLAGENDTDRDIRFAQEDAAQALARREKQMTSRSSDAPLLDSAGHFNLFPSEAAQRPGEKNAEAEKEAADKKHSYEDQYTMRFSNAAGFRQSVGQKPWYSSARGDVMAPDAMPGRDVWGNEDPMRREREAARMNANDPLAVMKKGVRQLRYVEQDRQRWNEEKRRELEALKTEQRRQSRHRRRRSVSGSESRDSLEGFTLDGSPDDRVEDRHRKRSSHGSSHRRHRHRRERSRDGDGDRDRSRDRSHRRDSRSHSHRHHRYKHSSRHSQKSEVEERHDAIR